MVIMQSPHHGVWNDLFPWGGAWSWPLTSI